MAFELYTSGCGYNKILNALNAKGYKTKPGKAFGKNYLHDIIESKDDDDIIRIEGGVPAIVSKETFEKARTIMCANKNSAGRYKAKENYLLSE
jgi:site-specific DNA recombinase